MLFVNNFIFLMILNNNGCDGDHHLALADMNFSFPTAL